ncbi:DUF309 domain-containing protein [Allosaccharopolyspora coralli]|uniref:DUF309 domain-containing protein n=1 Tax=Allosaccharopolyspora coralli TaxID=2665642 RepID=A0A5Q3Q9S8_9PSEU|nr:DUF309 domain-containing protein [Allosaccharopolyspora coralli]
MVDVEHGDSPCWADRVCEHCGRVQDSPSASECEGCGEPVEPVRATQAAGRRDRDEEGRARSARPRDALGRPLPYGTPGVERQPEGIERTPPETVSEAQRLLDEGKPFHAHEVFEDAWKTGPDHEEGLWRGLAQLAVGLTHAARGNTGGGQKLLLRGAANLDDFEQDPPYGIDVPGLVRWATSLAVDLEGYAEPPDPVTLAPKITG